MTIAERQLIWFLVPCDHVSVCRPGRRYADGVDERNSRLARPRRVSDAPLVQYMTRSMSLLYAVMGASYWFMSCDVQRYLPLLRFTIPCTLAFDVAVIALDVWIPMPITWIVGESIVIVAWTVALWWLVRRVDSASSTRRDR